MTSVPSSRPERPTAIPAHRLTPQQLRTRIPKLCIALSGEAMLTRAASLLATGRPQHRFFEFRLDTVQAPDTLFPALAALLAANPHCTALATCRGEANGGHFPGTPAEELRILTAAASAGCHIVDLSLESAEALGPERLTGLQQAAHLLLSWHDFDQTPALEPVHVRMRTFAPDLYKIVSTAQNLSDNLAIFDLLASHQAEGNLIALAMGTFGLPSRILGPRFGSLFTFAAPDATGATAPGQLSADTLTGLYRLDTITPVTRAFGVAGLPISASLSPLMHNSALAHQGVDAVYLPLQTGSIDDLLRFTRRVPLDGLSITMPLKRHLLPHLQTIDPLAAEIGAVNTILHRNGQLHGSNTDAAGILAPLEARLTLQGSRVLVLGAGGAARAAVFALRSRGAEVSLLSRTEASAQALATASGARLQGRDSLPGTHFNVILNATPYGMANNTSPAPLSSQEINCEIFFDLVYNPTETPLIRAARGRGSNIIQGAEMFIEQGAQQFERFTGLTAPRAEMRRVVLHALQQQTSPASPSAPSPKEI